MRRSAMGMLVGLTALAVSACSPLQPWRHELVSSTLGGTGGNGPSSTGSLHADENFLYGFDPSVAVFASDADDLVPGDTNGTTDVFVRHFDSGTVELVSTAHGGTGSANGPSTTPVLDPAGTRVAFVSHATDLVDQTVGGAGDVYVRDLTTGATTLVSVDAGGAGGGDGPSEGPIFSPDGLRLAFTSEASNLAADDANAVADVYVRDLAGGTTALASVNPEGTGAGDGPSRNPAWGPSTSGDSAFSLAFESRAGNLSSPGGSGAVWDVYVRRLTAGTTELVSVNDTGNGGGNADSRHPVYGKYLIFGPEQDAVFFESDASNLGAPDANGTTDVYGRDLDAGETRLMSATPAGEAGNGASTWPVDGASFAAFTVYFQSEASDLVDTDTNGASDIFHSDGSTVRLVSVNAAGTDSGNGASTMPGQVLGGAFWTGGLVFNSEASDLGPTDTNGASDVYLRTETRTELISTNTSQRKSGNGPSRLSLTRTQANTYPYGMNDSPVFESEATDLVAAEAGSAQVYMARPTGSDASSSIWTQPEFGWNMLVMDTSVDGTVIAEDLDLVLVLPPDGAFLPHELACEQLADLPDGRHVIRCDSQGGVPGPFTERIAGYVRLEDAPAGTEFEVIFSVTSTTYDPNPSNNGGTLELVQDEPLDPNQG
jgi:Tol biopolymer transport system component